MTEIIGHDCDGKPLRAGGLVRVEAASWDDDLEHLNGVLTTVVGSLPFVDRSVAILEEKHAGSNLCIEFDYLRRIDEPPKTARWEDICCETGWYPGKPVKQPEAA